VQNGGGSHLRADDRDQPGHFVPQRRYGKLDVGVFPLTLEPLDRGDEFGLAGLQQPSGGQPGGKCPASFGVGVIALYPFNKKSK
jgi:hypothetical protein